MKKEAIYIIPSKDWKEFYEVKKKIHILEKEIKIKTGLPIGRIRGLGLLGGLEAMLEGLE